MKDKYDQKFRMLQDDSIDTNKWTTWTQGRERMQVFNELFDDVD